MRIPAHRIAQIDANAPKLGFRVPQASLSTEIRTAKASVRKQIDTHHQGAFAIFEEDVKFVVAFEAFQYSRKDRPAETTPFVLLLARVRSDLLSIRDLLLVGQESPALAVARVFLEDIELTMATAVDPDFATRFMNAEDPDAFWSKQIAYGKIYPFIERFLHLGKQGKKISSSHIAHHRTMKSFLSQHVHPTFGSALRIVVPRAVEQPGYFGNRPVGWFGEGSGRLCLYIAEEVQAFSATCITTFIRPNPPPALANYEPNKELATFMRPAHNLQTLLSKYASRIRADYERKSKRWDEHPKPSE